MHEIDEKVHSRLPKRQILRVVLQNWEKSVEKYSIEKPVTYICRFLYNILSKSIWRNIFSSLAQPRFHGNYIFDIF